MPFTPGDHYSICDISGKKVLHSKTRKTWDGLRVAPEYWSPKHPQLSVRGIRERIGVHDGRPRTEDIIYELPYGYGSFCLRSPNGTLYMVYVEEDGALLVRAGGTGFPLNIFYFSHFGFTVDNDGALHIRDMDSEVGPPRWIMGAHGAGPEATVYELSVDADLAVHLIPATWYV